MEFEDDNILLLWWLRVSCVTKLMMQSRYNNTKYQTVQPPQIMCHHGQRQTSSLSLSLFSLLSLHSTFSIEIFKIRIFFSLIFYIILDLYFT